MLKFRLLNRSNKNETDLKIDNLAEKLNYKNENKFRSKFFYSK